MKSRKWTSIVVMTLFAALAMPVDMAAQDNPSQDHKPQHHQYNLIDLGTFGGPGSAPAIVIPNLNNSGVTLGIAQTPTPDPFNPNCMDGYFGGLSGCLISHAFGWRNKVLTDLGSLAGSSMGYAINDAGVMDGVSETGSIDPATGFPEVRAVVWKNGTITDLGAFGGAQSQPGGINNRGQVVGWAMNTTDDPFSAAFEAVGVNYGWTGTTQLRAFLWENGVKRDLGTLGGPDAQAYAINQSGQIAGQSFTSYTPNPTTGFPTIHPFLWDHGQMMDLGNLGGTSAWAGFLNDRGQVAGDSTLPGDKFYHGFLWDRGVLKELPPVSGGNYAYPNWMNNAGDVVGASSIAGDQLYHAPFWTHGLAIDLGTIGPDACSQAFSINSSQQIVGASGGVGQCPASLYVTRAFLWEKGGPMVDLNALLDPPSDLYVTWGITINDRGQILAQAIDPTGVHRAVLLVPHGDCNDDCDERIAASQTATPVGQPATTGATVPAFGKTADWLRNPMGRPSAMFGLRPGPAN